MKVAPFNTLHDGIICEVTQSPNNYVQIVVECDYLRERIQPVGKYFLLRLQNCRKITFKEFGSDLAIPINSIEKGSIEIEILSAEETRGEVQVICATGELELDFDSASIWINKTQQITQEQLENVAKEYWTEREAKNSK